MDDRYNIKELIIVITRRSQAKMTTHQLLHLLIHAVLGTCGNNNIGTDPLFYWKRWQPEHRQLPALTKQQISTGELGFLKVKDIVTNLAPCPLPHLIQKALLFSAVC